tara:strand:- start:90 stop:320 length:231 start_codon:yes stop_codon:yes gene_type:complete
VLSLATTDAIFAHQKHTKAIQKCQSKAAGGCQSPPGAFADEKCIPLFQFVARDYLSDVDDVWPVSSVTAAGRGSSL